MILKQNDYTDIGFLGTTGQTAKAIYTLGSTSNDVGKSVVVSIYDITLSNTTGTAGDVRIYSDIGTAGDDIYLRVVNANNRDVDRRIPFDWHFIGSSGVKQHIYASAFAGAGVRTYIGAILQ